MWASQQLLAIGKKSCVPRLSDNDAIAIVLKQDPPSNLASSLESGRIKSSIAGKKRLALVMSEMEIERNGGPCRPRAISVVKNEFQPDKRLYNYTLMHHS